MMADASYEKQHLALFAAGYISSGGGTTTTFGCGLTRVAAGHYAVILDASLGLVDAESFTFAQAKHPSFPAFASVSDVSNVQKSIFPGQMTAVNLVTQTDLDLEVKVYRSVTK